jgi:hypothetical protein
MGVDLGMGLMGLVVVVGRRMGGWVQDEGRNEGFYIVPSDIADSYGVLPVIMRRR